MSLSPTRHNKSNTLDIEPARMVSLTAIHLTRQVEASTSSDVASATVLSSTPAAPSSEETSRSVLALQTPTKNLTVNMTNTAASTPKYTEDMSTCEHEESAVNPFVVPNQYEDVKLKCRDAATCGAAELFEEDGLEQRKASAGHHVLRAMRSSGDEGISAKQVASRLVSSRAYFARMDRFGLMCWIQGLLDSFTEANLIRHKPCTTESNEAKLWIFEHLRTASPADRPSKRKHSEEASAPPPPAAARRRTNIPLLTVPANQSQPVRLRRQLWKPTKPINPTPTCLNRPLAPKLQQVRINNTTPPPGQVETQKQHEPSITAAKRVATKSQPRITRATRLLAQNTQHRLGDKHCKCAACDAAVSKARETSASVSKAGRRARREAGSPYHLDLAKVCLDIVTGSN